jgi:hypothetical protein
MRHERGNEVNRIQELKALTPANHQGTAAVTFGKLEVKLKKSLFFVMSSSSWFSPGRICRRQAIQTNVWTHVAEQSLNVTIVIVSRVGNVP